MPPVVKDPGELQLLTRRLGCCPDPLALYAALTDQGRPDTLLLESADITTGQGHKSILVVNTALRLTCRGQRVILEPLSVGGEDALLALRQKLAPEAEQQPNGRSLQVCYPQGAGHGDEETRLRAVSPVDALRQLAFGWRLAARPTREPLTAAGAFSYDFLACYETLPKARHDPHGFADYLFWLPELWLELNHHQKSTQIVANVFGGPHANTAHNDAAGRIERIAQRCEELGTKSDAPVSADPPAAAAAAVTDLDDNEYAAIVGDLKHRIVAGDVFQIVPSRTFAAPCPEPLAAYQRLRASNPSPYMFYLATAEHTLFGASPETCVKVSPAPHQVEIRPIAGTRRRGRRPDRSLDSDLDARLEAELRLDKKELAEHMMLVDLARNDVARVCRPGTRQVPRLLATDRYSEVMHLVTHVCGELRPELDALHAYVAAMNMGTLVGAPKIKAAQILRQVEASKRGPYGGAVGYLTADGAMDTAIVIRSALVQNGTAHVRAGAGVVYDSDPQAEADETRHKARAVLRALRPN